MTGSHPTLTSFLAHTCLYLKVAGLKLPSPTTDFCPQYKYKLFQLSVISSKLQSACSGAKQGGGGCSIPLQNLPPPSLQEENRILLLSRWLSLSLLHVYEAIGQTWLFPKCSAYPKLNSENFQTLTPLPQKLPPASCLCHLAIKYFISLFLTFFSLSRSLSQGPVC